MTRARNLADLGSDATGLATDAELSSGLASKQADVMTTKGDLAAYGTDVDRLAVGTNGQVLTADSGESLGVKWADAAGGLTLITTETFSAVSSLSINNCFTSDYQAYRIVANAKADGNRVVQYRLRSSGSDNTANTYRHQRLGADSSVILTAQGTQTLGNIADVGNETTIILWDLSGAAEAAPTASFAQNNYGDAAKTRLTMYTGLHATTTAFDGITISLNAGTWSGTLRIYGYKD